MSDERNDKIVELRDLVLSVLRSEPLDLADDDLGDAAAAVAYALIDHQPETRRVVIESDSFPEGSLAMVMENRTVLADDDDENDYGELALTMIVGSGSWEDDDV